MTPSKLPDQANLAIVIAAAGRGGRYGSDKMSERLGDRTVLEAAVSALREAIPTAPMVVVVASEKLVASKATLEVDSPMTLVIAGGERRQDSVRSGVEVAAEWGAEVVVIHDGARPVVHSDDVLAVVRAVDGIDGAILSARMVDTVKSVDECEAVIETIDRDRLRLAQTPQVFRVAALDEAWAACDFDREWSDEAAILEAAGGTVHAVLAGHPNPKITTAADLEIVRALIGDSS